MTTRNTLVLDQRLGLQDATPLHAVLLTLLGSGTPVHIDGSRVEEIDGACLQLLASLWRSAAARGVDCSWSKVSEPLRRAACLTGISETLSMPALSS